MLISAVAPAGNQFRNFLDYTHWLDRSVPEPLRPANATLIEKALMPVCGELSALENDQEVCGRLFLEQLSEAARRVIITQDAEFARQHGLEVKQLFSIGSDIKVVDSEVYTTAQEVFATKKDKPIRDITGKDVSIGLDTEGQNIVVKWSDADNVSHQDPIPDLILLSPNREARRTTLVSIIDRLGPTAADFQSLLEEIDSRTLNHQEISMIFDECAHGVAATQASLIQKIHQGLPVDVTDLVPQSLSYFERFAGPNPDAQEPEFYFHDVLVPYRKALLSRDVQAGLDICCLGALRDDLTPGQWIPDLDDDAVWNALSSCHATSNPFSLLGALDVALYRQEDERFREFAATAVATLLDERFGQQKDLDIYSLLQMLYGFVLNRLNLLEKGATYPGYWKRMGAWMQAGLIARIMTEQSASIKIDDFQKWLQGNMTTAGTYTAFVQARQEPMLFTSHILLRNEILSRLYVLTSRHEREGRYVPRSEDISRARTQVLGLPGPLEGHKRPTEPLPQETVEKLRKTRADGTELSLLQWLATVSQCSALGEPELDRVKEAIKTIGDTNASTKPLENLRLLESASIVAATNRNTPLADGVVDALVRIVPQLSTEEEISRILQILLQAASAYEAREVWFKWLEEGLVRIATHLSLPPNKSLQAFLVHLGEIEKVLPLDSWFHLRARAIALASAA